MVHVTCSYISGSNCSSYVKFQATVTMKEAFVREWTQIQSEERHIMLKQLFDFVIASDNRFVKILYLNFDFLFI